MAICKSWILISSAFIFLLSAFSTFSYAGTFDHISYRIDVYQHNVQFNANQLFGRCGDIDPWIDQYQSEDYHDYFATIALTAQVHKRTGL